MTTEFPAAQPHGPIRELFEDVFWVQGTFTAAPLTSFPRNMIILRHKGKLSLLNPIRLSEAGETTLRGLGEISDIVQLGFFHGTDQPYYVNKLGAGYTALADLRTKDGLRVSNPIADGESLAVPDTEVFRFRNSKVPECAVLLKRHGGLLISCDSLQHWDSLSGCSVTTKIAATLSRINRPANIGPLWLRGVTRRGGPTLREDYERLLTNDFAHLLGGHGVPLLDRAHQDVSATVSRVFRS